MLALTIDSKLEAVGKKIKSSKVRQIWNFSFVIKGKENNHKIEFQNSKLTGKKKVFHNDKLIISSPGQLFSNFNYKFTLDELNNEAQIMYRDKNYVLFINKISFDELQKLRDKIKQDTDKQIKDYQERQIEEQKKDAILNGKLDNLYSPEKNGQKGGQDSKQDTNQKSDNPNYRDSIEKKFQMANLDFEKEQQMQQEKIRKILSVKDSQEESNQDVEFTLAQSTYIKPSKK